MVYAAPALAHHRHHGHRRHIHHTNAPTPASVVLKPFAARDEFPGVFFARDYARLQSFRERNPAIVYRERSTPPAAQIIRRLGAAQRELGNVWTMVRQSASAHGVPQAVAIAIVRQESGGRCHPGGVGGIMQVLPRTARAMGVQGNSCAASLEAGMRYLAQIVHAHGTSCAALSLYNVGAAARPHCTAYGRNILRLARL